VDNPQDHEGPERKRWSRRRVVQVLDTSGVVMEVAAVVASAPDDGSPTIFVTAGLLAIGLHVAANRVRRTR
jgi:hypothetical protein